MTEPKREKKTSLLIKRIVRWIGLGLLTLLLILALIFQAPWKISVLLAIFLTACTLLPKRFRKWFWLGVGSVVIALIAWIFLPEDNEGWRPYKYNFDKELKNLETQYSIPPEENAATFYNRLIERYDANDYYIFDLVDLDLNTFNNIFRNPWRSIDYPEIADSLTHIQGAIETLVEISETEQCMFPIFDPSNPESHDKNAAIRRWARLLVIAVNNDIAEGRIDKAIQKIAANLQMAKHLYQQPVTIDFLNGMSVEKLTIQHMNKVVVDNEVVDSHINTIENALPDIKNDWNSVFTKMFEHDKLCVKTELTKYYEINGKGKIRLSRDTLAELRSKFSEILQNAKIDDNLYKAELEYIAYPSYFQKKRMKANTILRWFTMPSDPEKAAEILDSSLGKYDAMADPDYDWAKQPQKLESLFTKSHLNRARFDFWHFARIIADMHEEGYYNLRDAYLRMLTLRRGSRLLLAIKQYYNDHGTWPPNLDAIKTAATTEAFIDPVTGNPLQYENLGERFSLKTETVNVWPK